MGEYKYQHYVPKTYLNSWVDDNNQLYLYDKLINENKINNNYKFSKNKDLNEELICNSNKQ